MVGYICVREREEHVFLLMYLWVRMCSPYEILLIFMCVIAPVARLVIASGGSLWVGIACVLPANLYIYDSDGSFREYYILLYRFK